MILTKEEQMKVYLYFFGDKFILGKAYLSPIPEHVRGKRDRSSSFNIYESKNGNSLVWKDFGAGGEFRGDALDLIIHLRDEVSTVKQAIRFFHHRVKNSRYTGREQLQQVYLHHSSKQRTKDPVTSHTTVFKDFEFDFWYKPYLIDRKHLRKKRIYVSKGIDWGYGLKEPSIEGDPAFFYDLSEKGDMSSWKQYRPFSKEKKWKSWNVSGIPFEGYYLLPETGDSLMFTSGYKDGGVAEVLGWITGNPGGEGAWRKILNYQDELNSRFPNIYICMDGDEAGVKATTDFADASGWTPIYIKYPKKTGVRLRRARTKGESIYTKDLAEIVENYGYKYLKNLLNDLRF